MSILEKKKLEEAEASQKCVLLCKDNLWWSLIMSPNWLRWLHLSDSDAREECRKVLEDFAAETQVHSRLGSRWRWVQQSCHSLQGPEHFLVGFKVGKEELWTKLISQRPGCKEVRRVEEMFTSCRWLLQRNTQHFPSGLMNIIMMQKTITWLLAFSWGKL